MPGFIAKKLCPQLVIVKSHFSKYQEVSQIVREILVNYDPLFCPIGLDEAYLDITDYVTEVMRGKAEEKCALTAKKNSTPDHALPDQNHFTDTESHQADTESHQTDAELHQIDTDMDSHDIELPPADHRPDTESDLNYDSDHCLPISYWECAERVVSEIRGRIHSTTQLTASAGIAPNKMLAKIASDMNKPNGQHTIPSSREDILDFIRKLPIRKVNSNVIEFKFKFYLDQWYRKGD